MVWPVAHAAAEAYVFSAMLSGMPAGSVHRLGGWTQTSVKPSPLCRQQYEEQRRLLCNLCFKCGGKHWAKNCPKAVQGVEYRCPSCEGKIMISSRGQSVVSSPGQGAMQPLEPARSCAIPARALSAPPLPQVRQGVVTAPSVKRAASQSVGHSEPPCKKYKQVDVLGERYTALSWFLNSENPTPKQCSIGRSAGSRNALILSGGHSRALNPGFTAVPPAIPRPLCGGRQRVGCTELDGVHVSRANGDLSGARLSQVLFSVADLENVRVELGKR